MTQQNWNCMFTSFVMYPLFKSYSHDYEIIAVTDTWLSNNIVDNEILPINYTPYTIAIS